MRDPKTGRRVFRTHEGERPLYGADAPHLRIITDELWTAVQSRQELVKRVYDDAGKRAGLLRSSTMNSPYLFSGLLRCKLCGANLQIVSGRGRNHATQPYGCTMNFHRGDSVCSNRLRIRRDVLEEELLAGLQQEVVGEDVANYILDRFEDQLLTELQGIGGEMAAMKKRKAELDEEIGRLTAGLPSGIHSPAVDAKFQGFQIACCHLTPSQSTRE